LSARFDNKRISWVNQGEEFEEVIFNALLFITNKNNK
jgi:hypothetical protein